MTEYHDALPPHVEDTANESVNDGKNKKPFDEFINHQKRAFEETGKAVESLFPPGFREHGDNARKEFLKGMKVLVDAAVDELEKAGKEVDKAFKRTREGAANTPPASDNTRQSSTGKTKVKVQVD
jgi:hypothetical protein